MTVPGSYPPPVPSTRPTWQKVVEICGVLLAVALAITVTVFVPCAACVTVPAGIGYLVHLARRGPKKPLPPFTPPPSA